MICTVVPLCRVFDIFQTFWRRDVRYLQTLLVSFYLLRLKFDFIFMDNDDEIRRRFRLLVY